MGRFPPMTMMAWLRWDGIRRALRSVRPGSVLEIGAGQGAVGARLAAGARYVGVEPDAAAAAVARRRLGHAGTVLEGTVDAVPADMCADLVCAFEVLEHIEDDVGALSSWRERLAPGGLLLLSVPAHQRRFGPSDRLVGHYRRYEREELVRAVETAGYTVRHLEGYGFGLGHLLEAARNQIIRRRRADRDEVGTPGSGRLYQPDRWLGAVTMLGAMPGRALQRLAPRPELGVGWILLAQRSASPLDETGRRG